MPLLLPGQERAANEPASKFERHHHARPYAALVVRGSCDEAGDHGRFRAEVGDVLVHASFDAHSNCIGRKGATFVNIALDEPLSGWFGKVIDVDEIFRAYERDAADATALLKQQFSAMDQEPRDWPDQLATDVAGNDRVPLEQWAEIHGLHPTTVSRGFRLAYGVSPKRYRLECIASRAARRLRSGREPLAAVAAECGFADQAHMTRTLVQLFGATPGVIRAAC